MHRFPDELGAPDLALGGFQLWVHGPWTLGADPYDDWLRVTAHCGGEGASVWASGEILRRSELARWLDEVAMLYQTLAGTARLDPIEPNLCAELTPAGRAGHLRMRVEITPNAATQRHRFEFELDQSFLPVFLESGNQLLSRIAVDGAPPPA
ncbi:MAG: hypothetical protein KY467_04815 [Gemmatimonadetes bacterium]|nr:hypothetical protein [Gemmatimonadota bacterium]